jgi:iron(II)-dependent oxidoreductase
MIPEGHFLVGTGEKQIKELAQAYGYHRSWFSSEAPQRKVFLPGFMIDKYPVTNSQFARFRKSANYPANGVWKNEKVARLLPHHPVSGITWHDAAEYARWKGKRLPTEAEWEKAARGTQGYIFPSGDRFNPDACVWNRSHMTANPTDAVYAHPEGASGYGVMDMCGNLAEWCCDGPSDYTRFIKGGSWANNEPFFLRTACRSMSGFQYNSCSFYGFRCVTEVK